MTKRSTFLVLAAAVSLTTGAAAFGGWALVSVEDIPEYLNATKPYELAFTVKQHAVTPLATVRPRVVMKDGATETSFDTRAVGAPGRYVASIVAPKAGHYSVRIMSGFGNSESPTIPIHVLAANAPAPKAMTQVARGEQLFFAKGCASCHVRGDVGGDGWKFGPELTAKRFVADVAAKFLADPTKGPLVGSGGNPNNRMPQLDLKATEIASLVAYLNSEGQVSKSP